MYFGESAVRSFAHAVGTLTDNEIRVEVRGDEAFTDGKLVVLPSRGVWELSDFKALLGTCCHEIGHIWFRTPERMRAWVGAYAEGVQHRAKLCFNAIMDVADETRFARSLPYAESLFEASRTAAIEEGRRTGRFPLSPPPRPSALLLIVVGILLARSTPRSLPRKAFRGWRSRVPLLDKVVRILRRAQDRSRARPFRPTRTESQWRRLATLAEDLLSALSGLPSEGSEHESADFDDTQTETWNQPWLRDASERAALAEASGEVECAGWEVLLAEFEDAVTEVDDDDDWLDFESPSFEYTFDHSLHKKMYQGFRQTLVPLALAEERSFEDGWKSGVRLARPHRALIDGRGFRRWTRSASQSLACGFLFDLSHSMADSLVSFLPVGVAMVDAVSEMHGCWVAVWRFGGEVEKLMDRDELLDPELMGSTDTATALGEAATWLKTHHATRKVVVLFTDGEPDDPGATRRQALSLSRSGIRVLCGSMGPGRARCSQFLPTAHVFAVEPAQAAASLQAALRLLVRSEDE